MPTAFVFPCEIVGQEGFQWIPPARVTQNLHMSGGPAQKVHSQPRSGIELSGMISHRNWLKYSRLVDRLNGGANYVILTNHQLRRKMRWSLRAALDNGGGEHWDGVGNTENYPTGTWRSVTVTSSAAALAGATTLSLSGLLANEVVRAGTQLRIGLLVRYLVAADVTADAAGNVTVQLSRPLQADVAGGTSIRIPGDTGLYQALNFIPRPANGSGHIPYTMTLGEIYPAEATPLTYVIDDG